MKGPWWRAQETELGGGRRPEDITLRRRKDSCIHFMAASWGPVTHHPRPRPYLQVWLQLAQGLQPVTGSGLFPQLKPEQLESSHNFLERLQSLILLVNVAWW